MICVDGVASTVLRAIAGNVIYWILPCDDILFDAQLKGLARIQLDSQQLRQLGERQ